MVLVRRYVDIGVAIRFGLPTIVASFVGARLLLAVAADAAFLPAWFGNKLLKKVTMGRIQIIVAALLFVIAVCMMAGWL